MGSCLVKCTDLVQCKISTFTGLVCIVSCLLSFIYTFRETVYITYSNDINTGRPSLEPIFKRF